ncbi:MAG: XRE family transcriptional regulator, partial [Treponema sp.]|nr:XRE family transcriptional regulator [Treponema sp.]
MSFAEGLKAARIKKGFTQAQLGELIGVANTTISGYEKGTSEANEDKIRAIIKVLEVSPNNLFGWDGPSNIHDPLTLAEQRIGRAYGKATPPVRKTVEVALEPFMEAAAELMPEIETVELREYDEPAAAGYGNYLTNDGYKIRTFLKNEVPHGTDFCVRLDGDSMEPDYP